MIQLLKRHPFPVVAWFERVVAVSFAFPEEVFRPLVPEPLEIDSHDGFGFVTVALVRRVRLEASDSRVRTWLPDGRETLDLSIDLTVEPDAPPAGSPFADLRTARNFAGPMPFTFDAEGDGRFVVIEGKRTEWTPRPVRILDWKVGLFDEAPFRGVTPILANAFRVEGVPYRWEKGRLITPGRGRDE